LKREDMGAYLKESGYGKNVTDFYSKNKEDT